MMHRIFLRYLRWLTEGFSRFIFVLWAFLLFCKFFNTFSRCWACILNFLIMSSIYDLMPFLEMFQVILFEATAAKLTLLPCTSSSVSISSLEESTDCQSFQSVHWATTTAVWCSRLSYIIPPSSSSLPCRTMRPKYRQHKGERVARLCPKVVHFFHSV